MERGLHPIPSVIDLPSQLQLEMDDEDVSASTGRGISTLSEMKKRKNGPRNEFGQDAKRFGENADGRVRHASETAGGDKTSEAGVRHYDADVLTKVIVYAGIGTLAVHVTPVMFEILGWGV